MKGGEGRREGRAEGGREEREGREGREGGGLTSEGTKHIRSAVTKCQQRNA